jgi:ketosteroid isomerase-like protein
VSKTEETNKALVCRFFDAHTKEDLDTIRELLAPASSITGRFPDRLVPQGLH